MNDEFEDEIARQLRQNETDFKMKELERQQEDAERYGD